MNPTDKPACACGFLTQRRWNPYLVGIGIGLLSCFLIADEITVISRSADGSAPIESGAILQWTRRFYRSDVSEQADSKRYPLYTRDASC